MLRYVQLLVLFTAMAVAAPADGQMIADDCASDCAACCSSGNECQCSGCCEACCPTMEEVTEERSCWNVRCEKVCVPAIRFPWEPGGSGLTLFSCLRKCLKGKDSGTCCQCGEAADCCDQCCACDACCQCAPPKCGCVRCVRVLEKENYEVKKCRCKWEIQCLPTCDHCCTDTCCDQVDADYAHVMP